MIVLFDPQRWLADRLSPLLAELSMSVCPDIDGAQAALAASGEGALLVVCHPDGREAVALAGQCQAPGGALVLCGPEHPAADPSGQAGCVVMGEEGLPCRLAAVAWMLHAHEESAALVAEADRLRQLHTAGIELLGRVSHDLKGPLAVIKGYLSLILEERYGKTHEELFDGLGIVNRRAQQLELLVGQLLDLTRIERGGGEFAAGPVDIGAVVAEARNLMADDLRDRGVSPGIALPSPSPVITADKGKLLHILRNLISNAARHGRRGGVIDLRVTEEPPWLRIEVVDNGPGVDPAHGGAAFQRYFDDPAATGADIGVGLGLTVVRQFVRMHGGSVRVVSSPGGGASFAVILPIEGPGRQ